MKHPNHPDEKGIAPLISIVRAISSELQTIGTVIKYIVIKTIKPYHSTFL